MKKFISCVLLLTMLFCNVINVQAMPDDVMAAYANEIAYNKIAYGDDYDYLMCYIYDINKDGIEELMIQMGNGSTNSTSHKTRFYTCSYGKIVDLGTIYGGYFFPHECSSGMYLYQETYGSDGFGGHPNLYKVTKVGNKIQKQLVGHFYPSTSEIETELLN